MVVLETPCSRKRRMSSSLPLSRETPNEPFRAPELPAQGPGLGEALAGALGDQVALDLGEQREEDGHDFDLDVALALDADVLLHSHEGDACLGEGVEDGEALAAQVLLCGRDPQIGNGFHGLTMECGFWCFI